MQPWIVSMGLTAAIVGSAVLLLVPRLDYLAPYRREIFADHGNRIGLNVALALATLEAAIHAVVRATGLADLGKRVDLAEQSVRHATGDAGLDDALRQGRRGHAGVTPGIVRSGVNAQGEAPA